jgi:hypothetical protein
MPLSPLLKEQDLKHYDFVSYICWKEKTLKQYEFNKEQASSF